MTGTAYREFAPPAPLGHVVACTWVRHVDQPTDVLVLPDGCVDLVWSSDGHLFVAGPDLEPVPYQQPAGTGLVGVRLRPGVAATVLGVGADEMRNQRVGLETLWGARVASLVDRMAAARAVPDQAAVLNGVVARAVADRELDDLVVAAARELRAPGGRVADVASAVGLSDRQLQRRFVRQVGYGPKTFQRVMRFQRFAATWQRADNLAAAAAAAGYADQAHLARDCRALSGRTPSELTALWSAPGERVLAAGSAAAEDVRSVQDTAPARQV